MLLKTASKYMKQKWTEQGGEIKKPRMVGGDTSSTVSETDGTEIQERRGTTRSFNKI